MAVIAVMMTRLARIMAHLAINTAKLPEQDPIMTHLALNTGAGTVPEPVQNLCRTWQGQGQGQGQDQCIYRARTSARDSAYTGPGPVSEPVP